MNIFVASSRESEPLALKVCDWLERTGHRALLWSDHDLFPAGDFTLDRLLALPDQAEAAVFLLLPEDKVWYRGKSGGAPRDNVLFEYGIFSSRLGRRACAVITTEATRLASDLDGLLCINHVEDRPKSTRSQVNAWLDSLTPGTGELTPAEDRFLGTWTGSGKELFIAEDKPNVDFDCSMSLIKVGSRFKCSGQITAMRQGSEATPVKIDFKTEGKYVGDWLRMYYMNVDPALPQHGVFYLRHGVSLDSEYSRTLAGYYAGLSPTRETLVCGRLDFRLVVPDE